MDEKKFIPRNYVALRSYLGEFLDWIVDDAERRLRLGNRQVPDGKVGNIFGAQVVTVAMLALPPYARKALLIARFDWLDHTQQFAVYPYQRDMSDDGLSYVPAVIGNDLKSAVDEMVVVLTREGSSELNEFRMRISAYRAQLDQVKKSSP